MTNFIVLSSCPDSTASAVIKLLVIKYCKVYQFLRVRWEMLGIMAVLVLGSSVVLVLGSSVCNKIEKLYCHQVVKTTLINDNNFICLLFIF